MKLVISAVILIILGLVGWKGYEFWSEVKEARSTEEVVEVPFDPRSLGEFPPAIEKSLAEARAKGPNDFRRWLDKYRKAPKLDRDRLLWLEADYMILISTTRPGEAKKIYAELKEKSEGTGKLADRLRKLAPTYQ